LTCSSGDDVEVTDDLLTGQAAYYRRRADEYDLTAQLRPTGTVLEIACGTGLWTEALADWADTVTATDAAPEAIAIARERVTSANVRFGVSDVFSWTLTDRFDVIFFSAWLSHVPMSRFHEFWDSLHGRLAPGGRVLFIDEHRDVRDKETYLSGSDEIIERRLQDGSTFRIVKNFIDPPQLERRLRDIGWDCRVRRDGDDWIAGEARPVSAPD
jgi:demethylmenaquinone methyltransferase/2-methoxy-6-polyprenyl-1,4-benzoquinol methylase